MCLRCKKKGHWKAECPEKQHNKDGTAPAVFSGLTFLYIVNEESVSGVRLLGVASTTRTRYRQRDPPGHLMVDSAAGQALINEAACVK